MSTLVLSGLYLKVFVVFICSAVLCRIADKRNWNYVIVKGLEGMFVLSFILLAGVAEAIVIPWLLDTILPVSISIHLLLGLTFLVLMVLTLIFIRQGSAFAEILWITMASIYLFGVYDIAISMAIHASNHIILYAGFGLLGMGMTALSVLGFLIASKRKDFVLESQTQDFEV